MLEVCYRLPQIFYVHQDQGKTAVLYPPQTGFVSKAQTGTYLSSQQLKASLSTIFSTSICVWSHHLLVKVSHNSSKESQELWISFSFYWKAFFDCDVNFVVSGETKSLSHSSGNLGQRSSGTGESDQNIAIPDDVVLTIKKIFVKNRISMSDSQIQAKYIVRYCYCCVWKFSLYWQWTALAFSTKQLLLAWLDTKSARPKVQGFEAIVKMRILIWKILCQLLNSVIAQSSFFTLQEETGIPINVKKYGAKDLEDFLSSPCFAFLKVSREPDPFKIDAIQLDVQIKPIALPYIKSELLVSSREFFTGAENGIPTQTLPDGKKFLICAWSSDLNCH